MIVNRIDPRQARQPLVFGWQKPERSKGPRLLVRPLVDQGSLVVSSDGTG